MARVCDTEMALFFFSILVLSFVVVWLWFVHWNVLGGDFVSMVVVEADNNGLLTLLLSFGFACFYCL